MKSQGKIHPSIRFKLSEVEDEDLRSKLEMKYVELEVHKRTQVQSIRAAMRAQALAAKALAETQLAELDFIIDASEAFDLITTEPNWITRRSKEGAVILECLLTQNEMQDIARAQVKHVKEQVQEQTPNDDDGDNGPGMFED
ncbi:MAG: hypothetical protein ABR924_18535 [Terracidiphilus sp.]|jgi:paraquat-inducible protein B